MADRQELSLLGFYSNVLQILIEFAEIWQRETVCVCFALHYCANVWSWLVDISRRCNFSVRCQYSAAKEEGWGMKRAPDTWAVFHLSRAAFVGWFCDSQDCPQIEDSFECDWRMQTSPKVEGGCRFGSCCLRVVCFPPLGEESIRYYRRINDIFLKGHLFIHSLY